MTSKDIASKEVIEIVISDQLCDRDQKSVSDVSHTITRVRSYIESDAWHAMYEIWRKEYVCWVGLVDIKKSSICF